MARVPQGEDAPVGHERSGVRFEIRLLGPFTVLRDGRALTDRQVGSRKGRLLLKRLLVDRGQVVGAGALAEILWPADPPDQPERHLATLVSRLRALLGGEAIARVNDGYRFTDHPGYLVDLERAAALTAEAEGRLVAAEPALASSAASAALDLFGRGAPVADDPYADWAEPCRAAAAVLLPRAQRAAWTAALDLGDPTAAARVATAALADEPLDEEACRALMRGHRDRGEPALALAAYERLRTVLAEDLGTDPAPPTRRLHLAILRDEQDRDGAPEQPGRHPGAAGRARSGDPGFVGRQREVDTLTRAWSAATGGTAGLVLVVGEAGIGKTRLAEEVVRLAGSTGGVVARARCYEAERSLFLQPVADALRSVVVATDPELVRDAAASHAGTLADLVAEIGTVVSPGEYRRASPEVERRRVFEAVAGFVRSVAGRRPLLLFLDDLHLAGKSTLELLHFLQRRVHGSRVLLLATVRVEEGQEVLDAMSEAGIRLDLGPLPADAVQELARRSGSGELAEQIMELTRGHSLFVVESLRELAEHRADGLVATVPDSLRAAVVARMRRAGPEVEELLRGAATLGAAVDPAVLADLLELSPEETLRRMAAAGRARLVTEAGPQFEFANDLIREIAYQTTPLPVRIARHRRAAALLAGNPEAVAGHATRAGDWPAALEAWLRAGQDAADRFAHRDAERLLEQALEAAARAGDPIGTIRVRLARGRVREALADYQGAYEDHGSAAALARTHGRPDLELAALRQLGGDVPIGMGRPTRECVPYLEAALALAERTADRPAEVDILGRLAIIWTHRLRFDVAHGYASRATSLAEQLNSGAVLGVAGDAVKTALAYGGDVSGLEAQLPALTTHLRRERDVLRVQWAVFESAFPALARGQWRQAEARIEEALALSRESGYLAFQAPFLAHLGWVHRARGGYQEALRVGRRAADLARQTGHPWWVALAEALLGWTLTEVGAVPEAVTRLRYGLEAAERDATEGYLVRCLSHLGWASYLDGDAEPAVALVARAETLLGGVTGTPGTAFLHGAHASLAAATVRVLRGEVGLAERLLAPTRAAAAAAGWVEPLAWADLLAARCRLACGQPRPAAELAGAAARLAQRGGLPGVAWQAHAVLAAVRLRGGDRDAAATQAAQARSVLVGLAASLTDGADRDRYLATTQALVPAPDA